MEIKMQWATEFYTDYKTVKNMQLCIQLMLSDIKKKISLPLSLNEECTSLVQMRAYQVLFHENKPTNKLRYQNNILRW